MILTLRKVNAVMGCLNRFTSRGTQKSRTSSSSARYGAFSSSSTFSPLTSLYRWSSSRSPLSVWCILWAVWREGREIISASSSSFSSYFSLYVSCQRDSVPLGVDSNGCSLHFPVCGASPKIVVSSAESLVEGVVKLRPPLRHNTPFSSTRFPLLLHPIRHRRVCLG